MTHQSPTKLTIEEILEHIGIGWCGNPFCDKPTLSIDEAKAAIEKIIASERLDEIENVWANHSEQVWSDKGPDGRSITQRSRELELEQQIKGDKEDEQ